MPQTYATGEMTYAEIGQVLGISGSRVQQIERSALQKLRSNGVTKRMLALMQDDNARQYATPANRGDK